MPVKTQKNKATSKGPSLLVSMLEDWGLWLNKLKWSFISFKFLSFFGFCGLLVAFWFGAQEAFQKTVETATGLYKGGFIEKEHVKEIVINAQTAIYDHAFGHVATVAVGVLVAIVALKAVAQHVEGRLTEKGKDLQQYLRKND